MKNVGALVVKVLNQGILGCKVTRLVRDTSTKQSISFQLHATIPKNFHNDEYHAFETEVQVDIWNEYGMSYQTLQENIIKQMHLAKFELVSVRPEIYESDTNIVHKPLIFRFLEQIKEE